ncbi:LysR family transcriptional regulator, partial [Klebsiella quasipneumoniae]
MEIKWLEDFLALANTLNFSKAADERHVTQSAFSRRIKQLEAWLGTTL